MDDITIYGFPQSTYVRTVRMAAEEKGVSYVIEPIEFGSAAHLAVQPYGRVPAIRHGDYTLYETSAIVRYIDEAFSGPKLVPAEPRARAEMEKWISASNAYLGGITVRGILYERLVKPSRGGVADESVIHSTLPKAELHLSVLDRELGLRKFLVGDAFSPAAMFVAPIIFYLRMVPEGAGLFKGKANIDRWFRAVEARPSFAKTMPPMPQAA